MPKLTGPLLSLEAKGTIAKTLIFKKNRSGIIAKVYKKPKAQSKLRTEKQKTTAYYFGNITRIWQNLTIEIEQEWNKKAKNKSMSGFNLFTQSYTFILPSDAGNTKLGKNNLGDKNRY